MTEFSSHWFKCEADRFGCTFAQLVYSTPRLDKRLTGMGGGHAQIGTQNQEMISFWPTTHIRSVCRGVAVYQFPGRNVLSHAPKHSSAPYPAILEDNPLSSGLGHSEVPYH